MKKIVLCNGVFDVLHAGHVLHLKEARGFGDILIVSLTLDEFVNKGAGRPINKWADRALILEELRCVTAVVPSQHSWGAIRLVRPHIFVKGCDYSIDTLPHENLVACKEVGAQIRFTTSEKMSASEIIAKAMS